MLYRLLWMWLLWKSHPVRVHHSTVDDGGSVMLPDVIFGKKIISQEPKSYTDENYVFTLEVLGCGGYHGIIIMEYTLIKYIEFLGKQLLQNF